MKRKPAHKKESSNFLIQGSILAAAGIIVRFIGMFYKIPLANQLGDKGLGYYSAAYSVYAVLLILSSYSLPTAVSKMVASRLAKRQFRNSFRIFIGSMLYATVVGGVFCGVLWFGAGYFAGLLKMSYCVYALRSLAPTIWILSYLGVLRGYFQGHGTMIPTAVSQIFEQIVNAVISIAAAGYLFNQYMGSPDPELPYAYGAAGGTMGTGAGALTALLLCVLLFRAYYPTIKKQIKRDRSRYYEGYYTISKVLFLTVVPIIFSSAVYNISSVIDNLIFGNGMHNLGVGEDEIAALWGVYLGKYQQLFNIPVAISNSLSSSVIPSLAGAVEQRSRRMVLDKVVLVVRFSMLVAIPSAIGLAVLAKPVSAVLYPSGNNELLVRMLLFGSVAVILFSLSTVTNAVLQGINRMFVPILNAMLALILHTGVLAFLLLYCKLGIYAVLYSNLLFALSVCILNQMALKKYLKYRQEWKKTFFMPGLAALVMGAAARIIYQVVYAVTKLLGNRIGNALALVPAILAAVLIYFGLLLKIKCISPDELYKMPGGIGMVRLARKLHLI